MNQPLDVVGLARLARTQLPRILEQIAAGDEIRQRRILEEIRALQPQPRG